MCLIHADKPRVGVKTVDGVAIGFVFVDYNCSVGILRDVINQQVSAD